MEKCKLVSVQMKGCGFCEKYNKVKEELFKECYTLVDFKLFEKKNSAQELPENLAKKILGFPTIIMCSPGEFEKLAKGKDFEGIYYGCYEVEEGPYKGKMAPYPGVKFEYPQIREWILTTISRCYEIDLLNE